MSAIYSALAGISDATQRLNAAASRIAQWPVAQAPDAVKLSDEAVALLEAKNETAANVKTAHVAEDMMRATLNLVG
jgi:hypothetical protein